MSGACKQFTIRPHVPPNVGVVGVVGVGGGEPSSVNSRGRVRAAILMTRLACNTGRGERALRPAHSQNKGTTRIAARWANQTSASRGGSVSRSHASRLFRSLMSVISTLPPSYRAMVLAGSRDIPLCPLSRIRGSRRLSGTGSGAAKKTGSRLPLTPHPGVRCSVPGLSHSRNGGAGVAAGGLASHIGWGWKVLRPGSGRCRINRT